MRLFYALLLVLSITVMTEVAQATIYRYLDANGVTCYTDSLKNVPEQYRSQVVIVGNGKRVAPAIRQKAITPVTEPAPTPETPKNTSLFRFNWLVLLCLLLIGGVIAQRIRASGRIEQAFRIKIATLIFVLLLFIPLNFDLVRSVVGTLQTKHQQIQVEMKEQRERDKKPLKTLSEKVEEMMQQAEK